MRMSAKEMRTKARLLLDTVDRGEPVILTYRGRERARVIPLSNRPQPPTDDALFGIWKDRETVVDVKAVVDRLRSGRFEG